MYAVIGDSYISRLEKYVHREKHAARKYKFFGVPGMTTKHKFEHAFSNLKKFDPSYVFLNVGGNDLRWDSDVYSVFTDIVVCVDRIMTECSKIKGVWVCGVMERDKFPVGTGLSRTTYNRLRRKLNNLLRDHFETLFVDAQKSVKYPRHFEADLVHPKYGVGLK